MKKIKVIVIIALLLVSGCVIFFNSRSVNIIDAHYDQYSASIIVDHLPLTDDNKINWWKKNQKSIRDKYHIPVKSAAGMLKVYIWAFGEGYMERAKYDRLCFDDMKEKNNCIEKNQLMNIDTDREGNLIYGFEKNSYLQKKEGELIKLPD
ncbi:DUF943 family protein [Erwinia pyrifoliae]|uniref:DUF943 family protein n=1 Tax=Erwinia pyrifoliae TaxID=79967 RepID=A0ABY5X6K8_ERWPY|nr:DUF943 family protein [Erwinia pyrifoliae]AUX73907.1 DUF943 domain-containing protein [Erwinia pyrifoliae]MCA8875760.1 DUF943 family protein [Erwinia pyrifoliae]MCT2387553.1 DUF943 family protein [Erwinia pyrifoliae]MCU8585809.1 DUF943 family protein [Erwinia pyrifoliae]UWS33031.1 DUF943 family protein [Erwinia pyrifoliae]